ncbi:MAG TPA: glucokinase [Pseudomonadales bacterium]|nr:glucokinase [Pseudomonadales bacterium]
MARAFPRLLGDIGGTNSRWCWELAQADYGPQIHFKTADFSGPDAMLKQILQEHPNYRLQAVGMAVATPIMGDEIKLTNANWRFSIRELSQQVGAPVQVMNDFAAQAYALARIPDEQMLAIGPQQDAPRAVKLVLGPGTGLGVAQLLPLCTESESCWLALPGEGGHCSFAPNSELDVALLQFAWRQWPHVSWERIISGMGLELIYAFLAERSQNPVTTLKAAEITRLAEQNADCRDSLQYFSRLLGNAAANYALITNARGGVYLAGGVLRHFGTHFDHSAFRAAFESKGRFASWLNAIPTYLVQDPLAAFKGISFYLDEVA